MISVSEALDRLFSLTEMMPGERVPLSAASGRVLRDPVVAKRAQPPFDASAMDGYAIGPSPKNRLKIIGESAAGHAFPGAVGPGEAVRIFTGAPVPEGADRVVMQEDVARTGDTITLVDPTQSGDHIRTAGGDFAIGAQIDAPRLLRPVDIALIAAMNVPQVTVVRRPVVALITTGDELVAPGENMRDDQIVASNGYGLAAMLGDAGADPRLLPIARDNVASLRTAFDLAQGADLIVTIGGASVGDHDLVAPVAEEIGFSRAFHKVAMRPGKPLMSGRRDGTMLIGLPGNPVSSMVCGLVFVLPVIRAMLGLGQAPAPHQTAPLAHAIGSNGPREHYMRAHRGIDGLRVFERQDSSLLTVLAAADALVIRPPHDPPRAAGDSVAYLPL
jgi:molybdopterin molybdotransferase